MGRTPSTALIEPDSREKAATAGGFESSPYCPRTAGRGQSVVVEATGAEATGAEGRIVGHTCDNAAVIYYKNTSDYTFEEAVAWLDEGGSA